MLLTAPGTLLGGRVRYRQPVAGYRTGIEPVLLAASIPAQAGESVVEAGTGAGAGMLCLMARVAGISVLGIEIDEATAGVARANLAENDMAGSQVQTADVTVWRPDAAFDHAMANPPWHEATDTASPDGPRARAKHARAGLLEDWAVALGRALRPRGTLSLILPARHLAEGVAALAAAKCLEMTVLPLWPRQGVAAKLLILRGVRLGAGPCCVHPGLTLHETDGAFTAAASAVLRSGAVLAA